MIQAATARWLPAILAALSIAVPSAATATGTAADVERQADVARRGAQVMPFDLDATTHIFSKTPNGGTQRVIAKDVLNDRQVRLVREHLNVIRSDFLKRDFSAPARIHGSDMPGLAQLRSAKPDEVRIEYREVPGGAELDYRSDDAKLAAALHAWFDAQLSDHGKDATAGHHQHHRQQGGSKH